MPELRESGIEAVGDIPWGSHFSYFYQTTPDLLDTLVPYFMAGLRNKEFCLWIVSNSELLTVEEAKEGLRQAMPDLERYISEGSIEIVTHNDWFLNGGTFDYHRVANRFKGKLDEALTKGYAGMRLNGSPAWIQKENRIWFCEFEDELNRLFHKERIIASCTFPLATIKGDDIFEITQRHQFAIARRNGQWEVVETPELKQAKAEIKSLNEELEQRVAERTKELADTNIELQKEIAERKHAEALLHAREEEFRSIVENAPDLIARYDREFRRTYVNPAFYRSYNLPAGALIGKPIFSIIREADLDVNEDELAQIRQRFEDVFAKGKTYEFEINLPMPTGRKYFSVRLFPELDVSGSVVNVLSIFRDITERKEIEDTLRSSEDRIRLIIDTIPIMAWTFRPDGSVDFANQRWLDYAGEGAFEDPNRIVHPGDLPGVMEKWLVNKSTGKAYEDEMRLRRVDGEYRWFLVRTAPLRDEQGNPVKWYGVSIDIEDSKQAENKLRLAYQRLSYHVENTPLAVIEFDKDLFIKRWSRRAEEIFGWKESEALGKNVYDPDFSIIYKEDISQVDKINEQLMKGIVNSNFSLNRNSTKDGNIVYSEWYNSVLKDQHGNVLTILSLVHNVTERKKAEEQQEFEQRDKEALINTTDDMIWSVSRDLKLIAVNKAYIRGIETVTGVTVKPGDEVLMKDVVPPDMVTFWKEAYNRALAGESFKKDTFVPAFNNSAESWRETSFNPIYKDETVVALACHSRDITERKKAEETLQQSYEEIRRLTEHLQKIREEERIAIAREIHDELGQQLTVLKMEMKGLNKKLHDADEGIKQKFMDILDLLDATVKSVRRISSELRPSLLYNLGLVAAMEWHLKELEKRSGIKTIFNEPKEELELPDSIKKGLFRIFQESLTNVTRHANANKIIVTLEQTGEKLTLSIEDNGQGFEKGNIAAKETLGILGMKERSQTMGGNYEIISIPGKGTTVIVAVLYNGKNNLI